MQSSNTENLKFSSVQMDTYWIDEPDVLVMAVKLLIERATNQDWMLRVKWLYHLAKNIPQGLGKQKSLICIMREFMYTYSVLVPQQLCYSVITLLRLHLGDLAQNL